MLPNTDAAGAAAVARRMVHAYAPPTPRQADRALLPRVGTASWSPDGTVTKPAALLTRADQALYAAKSGG